MSNQEKKGIVGRVIGDMKDHAKNQHEITKERHKASTVSPSDAKEMFRKQHEYANLSPIEKQKIELEQLKKKNNQ